jgi:hypothetical protein
MPKKNAFVVSTVSIGLLFASLAFAQMKQNINPNKHPNLAAAQHLCDQAYMKIQQGQQANEWDMEGHAAKAKELLEQASAELKQAALTANENHH